ncbi:TPA: hypothetical protein ACGADT_005105 [Salmonella enterica subsp. enterica serovar Newport]
MTSNDVYEKIRKHLAEMNDIKDIVVSNDDHDRSDRAPGYIVALISERIACLHVAIHAHRKTHSQSLLSFRESLIHMLYLETGKLMEPSEISVNLTLVLLADRLSTISDSDRSLIAQWMSENPSKLSVLPDKTKCLAELHWHDLPSELFQDLVMPQSRD